MTKNGLTRLKTTLCERRRAPLEESMHMTTDGLELWVNGGKFNCWSESCFVCDQCQWGKRAICVFPWLQWGQGYSRCWVMWWQPCPGRPATNQRTRERERSDETLHSPRGSLNWLAPSAAHCAAKHKPDKPVTTQGRGRSTGRKDTEKERTMVGRGSEREGERVTEQKVKWSRIAHAAQTTKASCLCGIYWFHTWRHDGRRKGRLQNLFDVFSTILCSLWSGIDLKTYIPNYFLIFIPVSHHHYFILLLFHLFLTFSLLI